MEYFGGGTKILFDCQVEKKNRAVSHTKVLLANLKHCIKWFRVFDQRSNISQIYEFLTPGI